MSLKDRIKLYENQVAQTKDRKLSHSPSHSSLASDGAEASPVVVSRAAFLARAAAEAKRAPVDDDDDSAAAKPSSKLKIHKPSIKRKPSPGKYYHSDTGNSTPYSTLPELKYTPNLEALSTSLARTSLGPRAASVASSHSSRSAASPQASTTLFDLGQGWDDDDDDIPDLSAKLGAVKGGGAKSGSGGAKSGSGGSKAAGPAGLGIRSPVLAGYSAGYTQSPQSSPVLTTHPHRRTSSTTQSRSRAASGQAPPPPPRAAPAPRPPHRSSTDDARPVPKPKPKPILTTHVSAQQTGESEPRSAATVRPRSRTPPVRAESDEPNERRTPSESHGTAHDPAAVFTTSLTASPVTPQASRGDPFVHSPKTENPEKSEKPAFTRHGKPLAKAAAKPASAQPTAAATKPTSTTPSAPALTLTTPSKNTNKTLVPRSKESGYHEKTPSIAPTTGSVTSLVTSHPIARRTMDGNSKKRYEHLFNTVLGIQRPAWVQGENAPDKNIRIPGKVVRFIWVRSRLELPFLRHVWKLADREKVGSLDRDEFTNAMWLIDEELRIRGLELV